jgi:hypothetical protein
MFLTTSVRVKDVYVGDAEFKLVVQDYGDELKPAAQ